MGRDHWSVRSLFSFGLPSPERDRHTAGKTRSACCPAGCQRPGVALRRLRCEPLEDRRMLSVLMVDADAPAGGDGLAWATAFNDLQPALTQAATLNADPDPANDVDSIWIAEGTYKPSALLESGDVRTASFSLVNGVTLYGGFSGVETALDERDTTAHVTTLSGDLGKADNTADNAYTVVYCGSTVAATLDGLTITSGNANGSPSSFHPERRSGGGIFTAGMLIVTSCILSGNSAGNSGGGIHNSSSGGMTVANSMFVGNLANNSGGGIYNDVGTMTVTDCIFSSNSASFSDSAASGGGAIRNTGTLTVTGCELSDNWVGSFDSSVNAIGGGIYNSGALTITCSTLCRNSANGRHSSTQGGGGIFNSGPLTILDSTICDNSSSANGGGIYNLQNTLTVVNCTFANNSADVGGGIFGSSVGSSYMITVRDSTLSRNVAVTSGGGAFLYGPLSMDNTIVAGNVGGMDSPDIGDISRALSGSNNLIGNGSGQTGLVNGVNGNIVGTTAAPIDAMLDANGVPRSGSPAINAGSNAAAVDAEGNPLTTDKAGRQRILYGTVDIGAFETALPGDANQDYTVNDADAAVLGAHWLWRSGVSWDDGDFNADGVVDDRDAAILAAHWVRGTEAAPVEETPSQPAGNGATEPISNAPISDKPSRWMSFVGPRRPSAAFIGPVRASGLLLRRNENAGLKLAAHDAALAEGFGIGQSDDVTSDNATSVLGRRKLAQLLRMPLDPAEWLR